jgi:hypothetical protein
MARHLKVFQNDLEDHAACKTEAPATALETNGRDVINYDSV